MTELSRRLANIEPSATLAMGNLARRLKAEGKGVISLALGEPDFHTPDRVKSAGIRAIEQNITKYTASDGVLELKQAIVRKFRLDNAIAYQDDQIVVAPGTKPLFTAAVLTLTDPGDEVIIPAPYWVSYPQIVRIAGAAPVFLPCAASAQFKVRPDDLAEAITPRTRMLILNTPNNPTGAVYTREEFELLVPVLRAHPRVWVITDEIYEHIYYGAGHATSFAALAPDLAARTITVNGLSKGYVMTGWRIGFAGGPRRAIKVMADILGNIAGAPSSISQFAAREALLGEQDFIRANTEVYRARRDLAVAAIRDTPGLTCTIPQGTFYLFGDCSGLLGRREPEGRVIDSDETFVRGAIEKVGVVLVPGSPFGMPASFRLSYALDITLLRTALERLHEYCSGLR
jgi:aspartate aminotransferase